MTRILLFICSFSAIYFHLPMAASGEESGGQLEALRAALEAEPDRIDLLYSLSYKLEQKREHEKALTVARRIRDVDDTYDARMREAWLLWQLKRYKKAEKAYFEAIELARDSEDAWLGIQMARIGQGEWAEALDAGARAMGINEASYWARSRQALCLYMLERYDEAEMMYEAVLHDHPGDAEMILGLGFTLVQMGDEVEGKALCREAARLLPDDPRPLKCDKRIVPPVMSYGMGGYLSFLRYTDPWNIRDLKSLTATAWGRWRKGATAWIGVSITHGALRYQVKDFNEVDIAGALGWREEKWFIEAGGAILFTNDNASDGVLVGRLELGAQPGLFGGGLSSSFSFYNDFFVAQLDPKLSFVPLDSLTVSIGPSLILVSDEEKAVYEGDDGVITQVSGRVEIGYKMTSFLEVNIGGTYGPRSRMVEAGGLSVWTNDDRYIGGYDFGTQLTLGENVELIVEFEHQFGDRQHGRKHHFSLLGGNVGVRIEI